MGCRCSKAEDKDLAAERKRISSIKVQPLELAMQNKIYDQAINQDEYNNWEPKRTSKAELAENKLKSIEEELQLVGENMKSLETSAEKAVEREEKLKEKILSIQRKYKAAEDRFEYGEMSITKLNQKIDNIEDEIYREKLKIKKVADELGDTFDDMLAHY